ncbi:MAG: transposase family protein [Planctomycetaceae bacterium]|nr:transposase family protein [Planctomycetaceae bacterium]
MMQRLGGVSLAIDVSRRMTSENVLERLSNLFIDRGVPRYLRSDNGPEFTAIRFRQRLAQVEVKTLFIEPGSPWENGYVESFNGKLRDELLNGEIFETCDEAKVLIARWRVNLKNDSSIIVHWAISLRHPRPPSRISPLSLRSSSLVRLEKA